MSFFNIVAFIIIATLVTVVIILTPTPNHTCPIGYSVGDIIDHKLGTKGVIVKCNGGTVKSVWVDTANGKYEWPLASLADGISWDK